MDVDEFMSTGLIDSDEEDIKMEKQTSTTKTKRSQNVSKETSHSHKESLAQLQETDPEFFRFLRNNDQKLLEFSESESEGDESGSEGGNDQEETKRQEEHWSDDKEEVCYNRIAIRPRQKC